jgi:tRNA-specific 2-thiouridylase
MTKNKRVVVAMSGGVDSSVAAAMLLEKGYEVIGITMQLWPKKEEEGERPACCGIDAIEGARKVANQLGITHYVMDFREIFQKKVIEDFYTEYKNGRTPNPCIRCNQYIKFDFLLKKAKGLGADFISTGHFARAAFNEKTGRYNLKKALIEKNDQSYVLYTLTQEQLSHIILPLGDLNKEKVREYARKKRLGNSEKKSSQEICFTGTKDYREFISKHINKNISPGNIVTKNGDILGKHKGLPFYTIGQREGLGIGYKHPLYVIKIDKEKNILVVGSERETYGQECEVNKINFISCDRFEKVIKADVKIRYQHKEDSAELYPVTEDRIKVVFSKPQRSITPGQAAVFYEGDTVIGGGTIDTVTDS